MSFNRKWPTQKNPLQQKYETQAYEAHRDRIYRAQATVDTRPPRTYMHQHLNTKGIQAERMRLENIERENRKLLKRMSDIMMSRGRIDNGNTAKSVSPTRRYVGAAQRASNNNQRQDFGKTSSQRRRESPERKRIQEAVSKARIEEEDEEEEEEKSYESDYEQ